MLIRNIVMVIIIIIALTFMRFKKDDIPEQTIQKSAVWFVIFLGILYPFTYKFIFWKKYQWTWRLLLLISSVIYLYGLIREPQHFEHQRIKFRSTIGFILLLIYKLIFKKGIFRSLMNISK